MKKKILVKTSFGQRPYEVEVTGLPKSIVATIQKLLEDTLGINMSEEPTVAPEMTIPYYEAQIAERNGVSWEEVNDILNCLWSIQPGCTLSILLRAIAMEMDLNYPDHISQAKEWYVVNIANGQIGGPIEPIEGINFRNVALFRCLDDAKGACMILKPLFKALYGGKQKDKGSKKG